MDGLIANFGSVHVVVWALPCIIGLFVGMYLARRFAAMGTVILVLCVLMWSMFIGLIPIINHAISPDGLAGVFSGQGFAQFLEDVAPQAIFNETRAHWIEVIQSAVIGAGLFGALGLIAATVLGEKDCDDAG